jgi:hypothetical protein
MFDVPCVGDDSPVLVADLVRSWSEVQLTPGLGVFSIAGPHRVHPIDRVAKPTVKRSRAGSYSLKLEVSE